MVCRCYSLRRYRYPTDETLREAAGLAKNGKKRGKHDDKQDNGFLVPKNAEFQVGRTKFVGLCVCVSVGGLIDDGICIEPLLLSMLSGKMRSLH